MLQRPTDIFGGSGGWLIECGICGCFSWLTKAAFQNPEDYFQDEDVNHDGGNLVKKQWAHQLVYLRRGVHKCKLAFSVVLLLKVRETLRFRIGDEEGILEDAVDDGSLFRGDVSSVTPG